MRTAVIGFLIIGVIWAGMMVWFYFNSSRPAPTVCLESASVEESRASPAEEKRARGGYCSPLDDK